MVFSLFLSVFSLKVTKEIIINKGFQLFFYINTLNLMYYIFLEFGDFDSFKFLISRFTQFAIFSVSIFMLKDRFSVHLIRFIKSLTVFSLLASVVFNFHETGVRYKGIFFNPNEFSIIMVLGFSVFLFQQNKSFLVYLLMLGFLVFVFLSGSRSAIIGIVLSIIMFYRQQKISLTPLISFLFIDGVFFLIFDYN